MTIYKDPHGNLIHQGQQYTGPDGTTHPAGNDLSVLGYPVVAETPRPTDPGIVVLGWHEADLVQVWDTRPKTAEEIAAAHAALESEYVAAAQRVLDATARAKGYDNTGSISSQVSANTTAGMSAFGHGYGATHCINFTSNGSKFRMSYAGINAAGTYIFAAFAEFLFGGSNISPSPAR